jgi:hypothetical protein
MRRLFTGIAVAALGVSVVFAGTTVREIRTRRIVAGAALPADLTQPEGKTRWQLEGLALGPASETTLGRDGTALSVDTRAPGNGKPARLQVSGPDADRWLLPDHDPLQMKMGAASVLEFTETTDGLADHVSAHVATVGIGWVHLPSGPKEAVLERVLVLRQRAGERGMRPDVLIHRWVSPLEGVVAAVSGPVSSDGRTRLAVDDVTILDSVVTGAADLKLYADQIYRGPFTDIKYGWDKRGSATDPVPVSALVPDAGINNICDLANLSTWNFSGINTGQQTATTETPSNAGETCNSANCGYAGYPAGGTLEPPILERLDRNLTGTVRKDNQVVQRENRVGDVTFWLRAGSQNEGVSGAFGNGETRFCFTDQAGLPRNEVPIYRMAHSDAGGWYTQTGDTWSSDPVVSPACEQSFYNCVCGSCGGLFQTLYGRSCSTGGQSFAGAQFGKIVKGGVVRLPSGHTVNALLLRNTTEFCTFSSSSCSLQLAAVRTIVYIWQAPFVGSVALLRGPQRSDFTAAEIGAGAESPCTNFTSVEFTDISYGLFPPVSITAGAVTNTTVSISWNPGNDTHRISGYKIYWDTDSGSSTPYGFDSVANPGQISIVGTTATISGLTPGATYYVTVTSLSDFTDPSTGAVAHYESIKYPTTVSGDPNFSYPIEVSATTTGGACIPTQEVTGLTVDKSTPNVHVCWSLSGDPCAVGYDVLGSDDATSDAGWSVVGQVGPTTCWDGNPSQRYLLVRARGTGGNGPWGHYLH